MQSVVSFSVIPKCMTLNDHEWLFRVKYCFRAGLAGSDRANFEKQEAQLPLRNRSSAIHFFVDKLFSIAVMTHTYVYHLRNLCPMIPLICYAYTRSHRINFIMQPQHVRITRDPILSFDVSFLENPCEYPRKQKIGCNSVCLGNTS